jgi:phosphopantetheinyl transferase
VLRESEFCLDIRLAFYDAFKVAELLDGAELLRNHNGKPYLLHHGARISGISFTHVRQPLPLFSLVALCDDPHVGIDAEVWPKDASDVAFLTSVASDEDASVVRKIENLNFDAARFLWVAKEAALKASGEVMVDPRGMAVELLKKNYIRVSAARRALAPFAEMRLRVFKLLSNTDTTVVLVAIATPENSRVLFSQTDWRLDSIF